MNQTVKVRTKYQITIPEEVRKVIPLEVGSRVEVLARENEIVIKPVIEVPKEQAWFWTKEWQELERKATEDKEEGRIETFDNVEDAIRWLKS